MKKLIFLIFLLLITYSAWAQQTIYVASWNVENFYDTLDDASTDDAEFLPGSEKKWDSNRYLQKTENLAAVIQSMNDGKGPDIIGLCEVENRAVLEDLVKHLKGNYGIVHQESPDGRGIDNAILYRKNGFEVIGQKSDTIELGSNEKTRSILEGVFQFHKQDYLRIYVNHWPSRRGGESTEQKRFKAAEVLRDRMKNSGQKIFCIALGDFNDEPENLSIDSVLKSGFQKDELIDLAYQKSLQGEGTYKYRDQWNMLDQMIILDKSNKIDYIKDSFEIYKPEFMMTQSGSYKGAARPTFAGKNYLSGYSDHFPVTAKFRVSE